MGETTKLGFYKYDDRRKASPDPEGLAPFIAASRAAARLPPAGALSPQEIVAAIMFPVVNEASRVIAEGVVTAVKDTGLKIPLVVRLEGTNVEKGKEIINNSGLDIIAAEDLDDAAQKACKALA